MNIRKQISDLFDKKYSFENNKIYELPSDPFTCEKWSISTQQDKKTELNSVKSRLNCFNLEEWSKHTKTRDPSSFIVRFIKKQFDPELLTQV